MGGWSYAGRLANSHRLLWCDFFKNSLKRCLKKFFEIGLRCLISLRWREQRLLALSKNSMFYTLAVPNKPKISGVALFLDKLGRYKSLRVRSADTLQKGVTWLRKESPKWYEYLEAEAFICFLQSNVVDTQIGSSICRNDCSRGTYLDFWMILVHTTTLVTSKFPRPPYKSLSRQHAYSSSRLSSKPADLPIDHLSILSTVWSSAWRLKSQKRSLILIFVLGC